MKRPHAAGRCVERARQRHRRRQHVLRAESDVRGEERCKASHEETRADEKDAGKAHRHDDKDALNAKPVRSRGRSRRLVTQGISRVAAIERRQRHQREKDRRREAHPTGEDQNADVDTELVQAGNTTGQDGRGRFDHPVCEGDPHGASGGGQQQRLTEQQLDESRPPRTERGPHGEFPRPARSPAQYQVRNVRTGDQQDKPHRGQEHQQRRLETAGDFPAKRLRKEFRGKSGGKHHGWISGRDAVGQQIELRLRCSK